MFFINAITCYGACWYANRSVATTRHTGTDETTTTVGGHGYARVRCGLAALENETVTPFSAIGLSSLGLKKSPQIGLKIVLETAI